MGKFRLGQTVMTRGVSDYVVENRLHVELHELFLRHYNGDWGNVPREDKKYNDQALKNGERLVSKYKLGDEDVYIITEWDRSVTTVLFPSEY